MSDPVQKITDPEVNTEAIMKEVNDIIKKKQRDPEYKRSMEKLKKTDYDPERQASVRHVTGLVHNLQVPRSHRPGIIGRIANIVLSKLYLAQRSFIEPVLRTQERINTDVARTLSSVSTELPHNLFDYSRFQDTFRGSEQEITKRQHFYLPYFKGKKSVLELGCGRGEFLKVLQEHHIPSLGVDTDPEMVARCSAAGLTVIQADALDFLHTAKKESYDAIFASHFVEHISPAELAECVTAAYRALKKNSVLVLETPNPSSLFIFASAFYIDLTHVKPVHSETLKYLCTMAGFKEVEVCFRSEVPADMKMVMVEGSDHENTTMNENLRKLNNLIFGPQDYAIIARK